MNIVISDDLVNSTKISEFEIKQEIGLMLYAKGKVTLSKVANFVDMDRISFQHLLSSRGLTVNYDENEFDNDIRTLQELGRI